MRQSDPRPSRRVREIVLLSGWLLALLLALVVLFMFANPVRVKPQPAITSTTERLELAYKRITLQNVDFGGLLNNSPSAISDVKQRIQCQDINQKIPCPDASQHGIQCQDIKKQAISCPSVLQGRSVGLAIVYGGAPTTNDIGQANVVADKVKGVLLTLGQQGFAFQRASYYDSLFTLGGPPSNVEIDVYLFKK